MSQIRVLIVDDSSVMRKIVERSLRQAGLDMSPVTAAGHGAEALGKLASATSTCRSWMDSNLSAACKPWTNFATSPCHDYHRGQ